MAIAVRCRRAADTLACVSGPSRTTAELIVKCLENEGVTHIFGIPGEENIRLVDALSRSAPKWLIARPR